MNDKLSRKGRWWPLFLSIFLTAWGMPGPVWALIDANSASNTNAPPDGAPWDNVGQVNGASGVYVGGGWVLTASHVGLGTINFGGTAYYPDGTSLRLTNSDGTATDLTLFHLFTSPPLPTLPLTTTTPAPLSQIDMIGFGYIAGSAQTNFGAYSGFYWSANNFKGWGNNRVNLGGTTVINIGAGNLTAFVSDFTSPGTLGPTGQTSNEAQVSVGDSGGGVFQKSGSVWQLVGILDAEGLQASQPASTSVYGDETFMADIATYQSQVVAVLAAQPVPNLSISRSGADAMVCWPDTGVSYTLQGASSPSASTWTAVTQSQISTNGMKCVLVPDSSGFEFFRLHQP